MPTITLDVTEEEKERIHSLLRALRSGAATEAEALGPAEAKEAEGSYAWTPPTDVGSPEAIRRFFEVGEELTDVPPLAPGADSRDAIYGDDEP